jgi:hypothetical protein
MNTNAGVFRSDVAEKLLAGVLAPQPRQETYCPYCHLATPVERELRSLLQATAEEPQSNPPVR